MRLEHKHGSSFETNQYRAGPADRNLNKTSRIGAAKAPQNIQTLKARIGEIIKSSKLCDR
jgi:hypothetical protein